MISEEDLRLCLDKNIRLRKMWDKFCKMDGNSKEFFDKERKIMREFKKVLKNLRSLKDAKAV